jgi:hypothetical protein
LLFFIQLGSASLLGSTPERLSVSQHGIEDRQELAHASRERHLLEFASF